MKATKSRMLCPESKHSLQRHAVCPEMVYSCHPSRGVCLKCVMTLSGIMPITGSSGMLQQRSMAAPEEPYTNKQTNTNTHTALYNQRNCSALCSSSRSFRGAGFSTVEVVLPESLKVMEDTQVRDKITWKSSLQLFWRVNCSQPSWGIFLRKLFSDQSRDEC